MERLERVITSRRIRQRQQCQRCKIKVIEMWSVRGVPSGPRTRKRFLMPAGAKCCRPHGAHGAVPAAGRAGGEPHGTERSILWRTKPILPLGQGSQYVVARIGPTNEMRTRFPPRLRGAYCSTGLGKTQIKHCKSDWLIIQCLKNQKTIRTHAKLIGSCKGHDDH